MLFQRIKIFQVILYSSFIYLIIGLFDCQIIHSNYYKRLSEKNTIRLIPIEGTRGRIFDRNGKLLAVNDFSFDLVIIPQEVEKLDDLILELSKITGISKELLHKNYKKNYYLPFTPVTVAGGLDREKAFYYEEKITSLPGAFIWNRPQRYYPNKEVLCHVLGYVGKIQEEEFVDLRDYGYRMRDIVGKDGIEKYYDAYLKGESGGIQVEVDSSSREVRRIGYKKPQKGKDLKLTIDLDLQTHIDSLMKHNNGAVIIMDVKSGEILSLSVSPVFDPNIFTFGSSRDRANVLTREDNVLFNRAISAIYPPGSVFKMVIAYAGLREGIIDEDSSYMCDGVFMLGGIPFRCWKRSGHGPQNVVQALAHSCNLFFYTLGKKLGAANIHKYASYFGFGDITGIDLPGEKKGVIPSKFWKQINMKKPWYEGDTLNYAIGQGYLLLTPIQMVRYAAIIANEGYSPTPYIGDSIEGKNAGRRKVLFTKLKKKYFTLIKQGMFDVVNHETGSGKAAKIEGLMVAGKTGTAQTGQNRDPHAWFLGYMPADDPKYSFVVFLEHGGSGGIMAASMFKNISKYMLDNNFFYSPKPQNIQNSAGDGRCLN